MKRDLRYCWPRAERAIYYEPKNLVAHALATDTAEQTGKRKRTVYAITPEGRRAFERWLDEPVAAGPQFESEAMVRASFAHRGSQDALLRVIASVREAATAMPRQLEEQVRDYQETGGPFPEHLHVIALTGKFLFDYIALLERWADWAEAEVRTWPSVRSASDVPLGFAFAVFAEMTPPVLAQAEPNTRPA
jgi:DNA-binding PadR family transcriptional regulator